LVDVATKEAAEIFQDVVFDFTVVTFGAGFMIQNILTGFESCRVRVKNLPSDADYHEVYTLFTNKGIKLGQFHVVGMKRTPDGKQEADIICREDQKGIAIGLDGSDFRRERLTLEVHQHGMLVGNHSDVLTISWHAPSVDFVATYADAPEAEGKARELDRKICAGRRVRVEIAPAGHHRHVFANAVTIGGLPPTVTDTVVAQFSGSTQLQRLDSTEYDVARAHEYLRLQIEAISPGWLKMFETLDTDAIEGKFSARAHFNSWKQANKVRNSLNKQHFWFIGKTALSMDLPYPLQYRITISTRRYHVQKARWDSLVESSKYKDGCAIWVKCRDKVCDIYVAGEDKVAVGSLKIGAESLASGENVEHWHQSFGTGADGQKFLDLVFNTTGAYIRYDRRLRVLKAYGEQRNIDKARTMVQSEVERLESLEEAVVLNKEAIEYFVRRGLEAFMPHLSKDDIALDLPSSPCKITIRGGELVRRRLNGEGLGHFNFETMVSPGSKCPVCQDEITSLLQLACGHGYCTVCLQHFLTTASDIKIFPLSCMGDNNNCHVPIAISTIQKLLSPQQFKHLLNTAFNTYIERFPQEFRHCPTPGCSQVYRYSTSSILSVLHCPSCLLDVCSSCHKEAHAQMTCKEWALYVDPAEQERLNDQLAKKSGFRKCPECKVWIEKNGGCNHVSCKCGAQICWGCMHTLPGGSIFGHTCTEFWRH
jgi:IBR domain, a half RING-finger domain